MESKLKFAFNRLLWSVFVIVGLSILIFTIARIFPGDPARMALGPRAPQDVVNKLREEMNLDKPLPVQYFMWAKGVLTGDFGQSLRTKRNVVEDVKEYFPATAELLMYYLIVVIIFSTFLGTLSARYKDTWIDNGIRSVTYVLVAMPTFVTALLLTLIFGYWFHLLPVIGRLSQGIIAPTHITGFYTIDALITMNYVVFWDALKHLILPVTSLALIAISSEARVTRSSMVENMKKDYILAPRGFGVPENVIQYKYLLKPSMIPTVTLIALDLGYAFGNAFLVEKIFLWPGFSRYGMESMLAKDLNAISIVIIIVGIVFVVSNVVVDIIVGFLDPRTRLTSKAMKG